jgi:hypothetical protein
VVQNGSRILPIGFGLIIERVLIAVVRCLQLLWVFWPPVAVKEIGERQGFVGKLCSQVLIKYRPDAQPVNQVVRLEGCQPLGY